VSTGELVGRVVQRRRGPAQAKREPRHLADASLDPAARPFLTMRQLAAYLAYDGERSPEAARKFTQRNGLRRFYRGQWLVRRADVDAVLEGRSPRHAAESEGGPNGNSRQLPSRVFPERRDRRASGLA
jgi:hypothetical protein